MVASGRRSAVGAKASPRATWSVVGSPPSADRGVQNFANRESADLLYGLSKIGPGGAALPLVPAPTRITVRLQTRSGAWRYADDRASASAFAGSGPKAGGGMRRFEAAS